MKKMTYSTGLAVLFFSQLLMAKTVIFPASIEPELTGPGGILDNEFGLENLQRINDDVDQYWTVAAELSATAVVKQAGFSQNLGFIDNSNRFTSQLSVPYMHAKNSSFSVPAVSAVPAVGESIYFALSRGAVPAFANKPLFSSMPAQNIFCGAAVCSDPDDYMLSWLITDGEFAGDYVLAWEDLKFARGRDYNDLVVRVSGVTTVPVPAALWLFVSGLFGLVVFARRRI